MTLYRQLVLFTLLLFFVLFAGTWLAKLESTRSFLLNQLESHAQDTATSLGLSVSQYAAADDLPAVESMINAVFDHGYYRILRYSDPWGKVLVERELAVTIENVPAWFIRLVPLKTPEASANVMAAWSRAGTIYVKSHPGYAYKTLWENVVRMTLWFIGSGIVVLAAGGYILRVLLRPLVLVERQADALCRKEYEIQEHLPKTKELRRVVEAMNRMTGKVKGMFDEQVVIAEGLRRQAYYDFLTGLGNRRYFESQAKARLDRRESESRGILMLVQVNDLHELNKQRGYQPGDELLKRTASLLQAATENYTTALVARLSGGDFAVFIADVAAESGKALAEAIGSQLNRLTVEQLSLTDNAWHIGMVGYESVVSLERLLSEADLALRTAQQAGPNIYEVRYLTAESEKTPLGQQEWKGILDRALAERRIVLFAQSVVNAGDNSTMHREVFSRILQEDGSLMSAGLFLPFAEHLSLVEHLDRLVLEEIFKLDREGIGVDRLAVNLSPASLVNNELRSWLLDRVAHLPEAAPRINFEFPEFGAVPHLELIKGFSAAVRQHGHLVGLDHYGRSFSHLGYLKTLQPDYVKIDKAYTGELQDAESDSRFFVASLCSVAHSLDIRVIAEGVETERQLAVMKELNLDGIQGYAIDRPKPLLAGKEEGNNRE